MDAVLAIVFIGGIFALGYWIGSMRANLRAYQALQLAPVRKPATTTPRKKVAAK